MNKMTTMLALILIMAVVSTIYTTKLKDDINQLEVENNYIQGQNEKLKTQNKRLTEERDNLYREVTGIGE